jgi:hypothetical protein
MEHEDLLLWSQEAPTAHYPEPVECGPHPHILFPEDPS